MAESTVLVKIVTQGQRKLDKLREALDRTKTVTRELEGATRDVNGRLRDARGRFIATGRSADQASKGVNKLAGAVKGLFAGLAVLETAKFTFAKTAELETQTRSLQVLTGELETAKDIISELQSFAAVTPFTSSDLIDTAKRLKAFGVDTEILVETTKRLGDVAGATGAELNGIATAYGQITAKGKLQTEELLQLQERGVDLASILKKEYNLTGEEFSKALQKGQISAEAVEFALKKLTDTGGQYANGAIAQSDTLAGKFSTLVDGIENLARTIGTVLAPALKGILDLAILVTNQIQSAIFAATNPGAVSARRDIESGLLPLNVQGTEDLFRGTGPDGRGLEGLKKQAEELAKLRGQPRNEILLQLLQDRLKTIDAATQTVAELESTLPELLGGNNQNGGNSSSGGRVKGIDKSVDAVKRLAKELALATEEEIQAIQNQDQIIDRLNLQVAIAGEKNELKKLELGYLLDILELEQEIKNRSEGASAIRIQQLNQEYDLRRKIIDEQFDDNFYSAGFAMGAALADDLSKVNTELTDTEQLLNNSFNIVTDGLTNGIKGLIDGTKEWNDVLSDVLGNIGNLLLQFGFNSLGKGLKIPGFAEGGVLPSNGPAIVGENGPELVMSSGGQSRVFSNRDSQAALSRYSPANARSIEELAMSGQGGKAMSWAFDPVINVSTGNTLVFEGTNYVTQEDFQAGVSQAAVEGAKAGEARTLRRLRMSPGTRSKLGF